VNSTPRTGFALCVADALIERVFAYDAYLAILAEGTEPL
jgi:hypothetical protein